jgi:hypothetical protein
VIFQSQRRNAEPDAMFRGPRADHLDRVMERAEITQMTAPGTRHFGKWMAFLPGTSLETIFREDAASALAALRTEVEANWLPILRELKLHETAKAQRGAL